jgi:hypothetical protein
MWTSLVPEMLGRTSRMKEVGYALESGRRRPHPCAYCDRNGVDDAGGVGVDRLATVGTDRDRFLICHLLILSRPQRPVRCSLTFSARLEPASFWVSLPPSRVRRKTNSIASRPASVNWTPRLAHHGKRTTCALLCAHDQHSPVTPFRQDATPCVALMDSSSRLRRWRWYALRCGVPRARAACR